MDDSFSSAAASATSTSKSESGAGPSRAVSSLLENLRSPARSVLARKWAVRVNLPPKGKRTCRGPATASEPKGASPSQRVKENPDQSLTVSNGRLFCKASREELSLKSRSVKSHVRSTKHRERHSKCQSVELQERDIALAKKCTIRGTLCLLICKFIGWRLFLHFYVTAYHSQNCIYFMISWKRMHIDYVIGVTSLTQLPLCCNRNRV